ncbi:MAG: hypothetical protein E6640_03295 [Actinomyces urogenitalis]|uniref:hypothetical protein n=2 Tax=Actinomyces TaxID=1654 RepID=UPI0029155978|nr:hypothetical protein [Actinomyces urogenitalis]MDU6151232.1 hypothetical protein [Actinomyces urogenitalis]
MMVTIDALYREVKKLEKLLENRVVEPKRTLSLSAVEELTGLPRKRLLAAIRAGELVAIEAGERTKVVRPADLDAWLEWLEARS